MIRVLLVDDHAVVRAGYRRYLEQAEGISVLAEASSADEGYAAWSRESPDVGVVDISMPGASGVQLIRRIVAREAGARLLAFSMHAESLFVSQAMAAGASGYITKNSAGETLIEAVRQVHAGRRFFSPDVQPVAGHFSSQAGVLAGPDALTPKEFEVFRMLAQGRTLAEIASALKLSQKTVANYQSLIKEKLGVATTAALIHLALRHGVISQPGG